MRFSLIKNKSWVPVNLNQQFCKFFSWKVLNTPTYNQQIKPCGNYSYIVVWQLRPKQYFFWSKPLERLQCNTSLKTPSFKGKFNYLSFSNQNSLTRYLINPKIQNLIFRFWNEHLYNLFVITNIVITNIFSRQEVFSNKKFLVTRVGTASTHHYFTLKLL